MNNAKKYYFYVALYNIAMIFCSGVIVQAFFLEIGFTDKQVYLYNSLIQAVQVFVMFVMIFFSSRIRNIKVTLCVSVSLVLVQLVCLLIGAVYPQIGKSTFLIAVFVTATISYVGIGAYGVLSYCLPYYIMDMKEYGRLTGIAMSISSAFSILFSVVHSFILKKFEFYRVTACFFALAIICIVLAVGFCFSLKETKPYEKEKSDTNFTEVFKNKSTYILSVPNFVRGLATGVVSVITVMAISEGILDVKSSSYINVLMQVATLLGNIIYVVTCKKFTSRKILMFSTVFMCVLLPISMLRGKLFDFCVFYFFAYFFMMIINTVIPIMVTEIFPKNQIGEYSSIRMMLFTAGVAVGSILVEPISKMVGYVGILIFASIMQFICCLGYYIETKRTEKEKSLIMTETQE